MRRLIFLFVAASVVLAGCGDDDGSGASATTASPVSTSSTAAAATSTTAPADGELPGEPIDTFPYADAELAVVGVAADDTLNVRAAPGTDGEVLFELDPLATGVIATGQNRQLDDGTTWAEVTTAEGTGWASTDYLLQLGAVDDVTSTMFPDPDDLATAGSMVDVARTISESLSGGEDPPSRITIVDGPHEGDLAEITLDVLGLGDDSVFGLRFHLFAEVDGGTYTLRTIEQTSLCGRGVDPASGFCL